MQLIQELHKLLNEGAVADRYEELKDSEKKCSTYMCVDAKLAEGPEIGQVLPSINPPSTSNKVEVKKGDYVARVVITGSIENPRPMSRLFMIEARNFAQFSQLAHSKPDVEGFLRYEVEGEECVVVRDGSRFIVKLNKDLTQMPASLFNKQYRVK